VEHTDLDANVLVELLLKKLEGLQKENILLQAQVISMKNKLNHKDEY